MIQRCIVFQINVKRASDFSMEVVVTDLGRNRRNLLFSTSHKELNAQPLSARIPIKNVNRNQWTNFSIDLAVLINEIWKNQTFKSIDAISICANCKLRKIFTLKAPPNVELGLCIEDALHTINFPEDTDSIIQLFNLNEPTQSATTSNNNNVMHPNSSGLNQDLALSSARSKSQNVFKIAFGSKIARGPASAASHSQLTKSKPTTEQNDNCYQSLNSKWNIFVGYILVN